MNLLAQTSQKTNVSPVACCPQAHLESQVIQEKRNKLIEEEAGENSIQDFLKPVHGRQKSQVSDFPVFSGCGQSHSLRNWHAISGLGHHYMTVDDCADEVRS